MKNRTRHITNWLLQQSLWMHATAILVTAYWLMQMSFALGWANLIEWVVVFVILFLPVLLFAGFRQKLVAINGGGSYKFIWLGVFILYPALIAILKLDQSVLSAFPFLQNNHLIESYSFLITAGVMLIIELTYFLLLRKKIKHNLAQRLLKLSIFKVSVIVISILAILAVTASTYFVKLIAPMSFAIAAAYFVYYAVQAFFVYFSYYIYYYIHHHILFNGLLKKKGLIFYLIGLVALLVMVAPIQNQLISFLPLGRDLKIHTTGLTSSIFDVLNFTLPLMTLAISLPFIIIIEWYKQSNAINLLEKEKSQSELNLLKQQINPHFFFNTLNNLYSMSLTNEKETPETILQLSELMRYVIYKGKEEKVKLSEEVKYIQDYIDLQKIRLHKKLDIQFNIDIQNYDLEIPPLLFIIFVENAFKHGIEPAENSSFLHINLVQKDVHLSFNCHNSLEKDTTETPPGIGLQNLRKRLDILFPNQYNITVKKTSKDYTIDLKLDL